MIPFLIIGFLGAYLFVAILREKPDPPLRSQKPQTFPRVPAQASHQLRRPPVDIDVAGVIKAQRRLQIQAKQAALVHHVSDVRIDRVRRLFADIGLELMTVGENRGSLYYKGDFCGLLVYRLNEEILIRIFSGWAYLDLRQCVNEFDSTRNFLIDLKIEIEYQPWLANKKPLCNNPRQ